MMDNEFNIDPTYQATLVSLVSPNFPDHTTLAESERSMTELRELLRTLGLKTGSAHIQNKKDIDPATILGSGKLSEIAEAANDEGSKLLVFDFELTARQITNIRKLTGLSVVDRVHVILEIFAKHARTKEAKIQIEIARLQYMLPRLAGFWSHLNRQRGGVGVLGGEGEKQIELDRRIIREKIEFYKEELVSLEKQRVVRKKRRENQAVTAALVGYTNAGKSSIMNRLCRVDILEENKLFATLDSTYRMLNPDTKPPMIMIDTVGFISNLPNTLIDGFKTTLESALEADLLIIVCDISDPHYEKQLEVTNDVLKELDVENKERLIVFNKKDQLHDDLLKKIILRKYPNSFLVSSYDPEDMKALRSHIVEYFLKKQEHYDLFVPYEDGSAHSALRSKTNIVNTHNHEKGIFYRIRVPEFIFGNLGIQKYVLAPNDPRLSEAEWEEINP
ncbi:MAG: GTPase HflX [Bacteriovorax sp.]|jgi:GTP-binding protein HflX